MPAEGVTRCFVALGSRGPVEAHPRRPGGIRQKLSCLVRTDNGWLFITRLMLLIQLNMMNSRTVLVFWSGGVEVESTVPIVPPGSLSVSRQRARPPMRPSSMRSEFPAGASGASPGIPGAGWCAGLSLWHLLIGSRYSKTADPGRLHAVCALGLYRCCRLPPHSLMGNPDSWLTLQVGEDSPGGAASPDRRRVSPDLAPDALRGQQVAADDNQLIAADDFEGVGHLFG